MKVGMKVGDRVRVIESVIVYHHPNHKKQAFDVKGLEGEVNAVITDWQGRAISPTLPILVQFEKNFKGHFRQNELEIVASGGE